VHRHWLSITHQLHLRDWYYHSSSPWTLDYPPLFAYFEYLLSLPATLLDAGMVGLSQLEYTSFETILYQRSTVILSEFLLFYALKRFILI
jgi:alpha-1,3-glucosyltransferase